MAHEPVITPINDLNSITLSPDQPPPSARVRVEFGGLSHVGKVRTNNEDHYLIAQLCKSIRVLKTNLRRDQMQYEEEEGYLMAVADGMGGAAAGERASAMAVERIEMFALRRLKWFFSFNDREESNLLQEFRAGLERLDRAILAESHNDLSRAGMGTTLTAATSFGADLFVVHVGDSRAYLFHDNELQQLTRDHTLAQQMVDVGLLQPEEARVHRRRHVLTNVLGGGVAGVHAEVHKLHLASGDRLLLCSDGLSEPVDDVRMAELLRQHPDPGAACVALIDEALNRGAPDNVSVIVAAYTIK